MDSHSALDGTFSHGDPVDDGTFDHAEHGLDGTFDHGDPGLEGTFDRADGSLGAIFDQLGQLHARLCPRQVLGARIGLLGLELLGLTLPQAVAARRLLTFVETDGCFADGVGVATGCSVGHRSLRVEDQGKVGATLLDTASGRAVRVWPRRGARQAALGYAPPTLHDRWHAQRAGYQAMPIDELLQWTDVKLAGRAADILSQPGLRVACVSCDEEIINGREVQQILGGPYCRACAGLGYLQQPAEAVARRAA